MHGGSLLCLRLRGRGVYLITGGLGGLGLELADYLARSVKARIVLMGRGRFPPRCDWGSWLKAHDRENELSAKIRRLQDIEAAGGECLVVSADVTNRRQLEPDQVGRRPQGNRKCVDAKFCRKPDLSVWFTWRRDRSGF